MKPKIGVDIDGVLVDSITPLLKYHNEIYGTSLSLSDVISFNLEELWGGTEKEAIQKFYDFYKTREFREIKPFSKSRKILESMSKNYDLYIITSRPLTIYAQTKKMIDENLPNIFSEIYFSNSWSLEGKKLEKHDICLDLEIDILIEDSLKYSIECASRGVEVLLYDWPWNQSNGLPKNITRVYSWLDILAKI